MMKRSILLCLCLLVAIKYGDAQIDQTAVFAHYQVLRPGSSSFAPSNQTSILHAFFNTTLASAYITAEISNNVAVGNTINSDPNTTCSLVAPSACHADASCSNLGNHQYQCSCNSGYNDTSSMTYAPAPSTIIPPGTTCTDINECLNAVCGVAVAGNCTNTGGSYTCACNSGFNATMNTCIDIDECASSTHNCHTDATCANTQGSFVCTCNPGYTGNGTTCADIDECATGSVCGSSIGNCSNTMGSYTCACSAGYFSNNGTCIDIPECSNGNHTCDTNAACTETSGSFSCLCNNGYAGNGMSGNCSDVDECTTSSPCDANANCSNNLGSFSCACNTGFQGSGLVCSTLPMLTYCYTAQFVTAQVLNGTVASRSMVVQPNVVAVVSAIRADSTSDIFYPTTPTVTLVGLQSAGNGTQFVVEICFSNVSRTADELTAIFQSFNYSSLPIDSNAITFAGDIDECADFSNCSHTNDPSAATCANTNGSFNCMCTDKYHDVSASMETGVTCISPINITCNSSNTLFASISIPYLSSHNITVTEVFVGTCMNGSVSGDALTFSGLCGAHTTANSTHIISEWNVTNDDPTSVIVSGEYINFPLSCSFPRNANTSINVTSNIAQSFVDGNGVVGGGLSGTPGFTVDSFAGSGFANALALNPVSTGDRITFRASQSNPTTVLSQVTIQTARARPTGNPNIFVDLISNGCPASGSNLNNINPTSVADPSGAGVLSLDAFFFRGYPGTTIELEVQVCLRNSLTATNCQINCASSGKRKRSLISFRMKRSDDVELRVSFVRDPNDICDRDCGNGACVLDFNNSEECVCAANSVKDQDGSCSPVTIVDNSTESPVGEETEGVTLYILIGLGSLIFIMVALAVFIILFKRKSKVQKEYQLDYVNTNAIKS